MNRTWNVKRNLASFGLVALYKFFIIIKVRAKRALLLQSLLR